MKPTHKATTFRPTPDADKWLTEQSKRRRISKNGVINELIRVTIEKERAGDKGQ